MPEPSDTDVAKITALANTLDADACVEWLASNDCLVEQAWLSACQEALERNWVITVMTAYAHAHGELESIRLALPGPYE